MGSRVKQMGLVLVGVVAGILVSLNFQAIADRTTRSPLPIAELRAFTEVFGAIKSNYVEPVEDNRLITKAINGMLSGLDPHSAYLDADAFKDLQVSTHGQFGGLGIEVGTEDGFVKVVSPIEDTPAFKVGIKPGDLIIKLDTLISINPSSGWSRLTSFERKIAPAHVPQMAWRCPNSLSGSIRL